MPETLDMVVLFAVLYVIHSSFRQITFLGFLISSTIAISINYYLVSYQNVNFPVALLIVVILFPIIQIPLKLLVKGTFLEQKKKRVDIQNTRPIDLIQGKNEIPSEMDPTPYLPDEIQGLGGI
jgi:hypothetical protein